MIPMRQLLPIGRFSEMTRLSVKALRHYDAIGLLQPAEVDPSSGYRYYLKSQTRRAEAIRLLRGVDLPLDEIATVLAPGVADDVVEKVLDRHRDRLDEELSLQRRRLATVRRLIDGEEPLMPYDVTTRTTDPTTIVGVRRHTDLRSIGQTIGEGMGAMMAAVAGAGDQPAGPPMVIYHEVIDAEQAGDIECAIPVAAPVRLAEGDAVCRELEGGPVAVTVHRGDYAEIAAAYHVLEGWMGEHAHRPAAPPREVYLNDPQEVDVEEQLTEVVWPYA